MNEDVTNVVDVNNSNTNDTNSSSENVATAPTPINKIVVKATIMAVDRGKSEDTKDKIFFRVDSDTLPKTDENGIHSYTANSFGKGIQCAEDLLSLYPVDLKSAYKEIEDDELRLKWLNMLFQSLTGQKITLMFEIVPANVVYKGTQHTYEWWNARKIVTTPPTLSDRYINRMLDKAEKFAEDTKASAEPEWTTIG